jgi:hypothetical protein
VEDKDDVLSKGPGGYPELRVCIRQNNEMLGDFSIREFQASGEVPGGLLIGDAVKYWNELPQNKKSGVTAHTCVVMMSHGS